MLKATLAAAAVTFAFMTPAFAASTCDVDDTSWKASEAEIMAMPDGAEKTAAMEQWKIATDARMNKQGNECDDAFKKAMDHKDKGKKS